MASKLIRRCWMNQSSRLKRLIFTFCCCEFCNQPINFLSLESSITSGANTVCTQYSLIAPAYHRIDMHVEKTSCIAWGYQIRACIDSYHILAFSPYNCYGIPIIRRRKDDVVRIGTKTQKRYGLIFSG